MTRKITATQAVRRFSDLLGTIKFRGARYTILRGGRPVATLGPVEPLTGRKKLAELQELLTKIPPLGKEAAAFERQLKRLAAGQPHPPSDGLWE